jgi:4-hydroxythreonine-4-phosphate dehydrogenase
VAPPILALTQGDPAGIGPEILLKAVGGANDPGADSFQPLLVAERTALERVAALVPDFPWDRLVELSSPDRVALERLDGAIGLLDPVAERRAIEPGHSTAADAAGALAALDAGIALARSGAVDALVTAPVAKESIARHLLPGFVGHTDYLAEACGLTRYGRDYLMAFLAPGLKVALLTVHLPLRDALERVTIEAVIEALACLDRHTAPFQAAGSRVRIAVAGLNPHAGEGGLLGSEEESILAPAIARARESGVEARGPESADSLFARARRGEFDWVLALYHDQGLIAVKTAAFGEATNWTLGLPFLRTSVDHGTAFAIAGSGRADAAPLRAVIRTTLELAARLRPSGARASRR